MALRRRDRADQALLRNYVEGTGAIVMGRRSFDKNEGDGGWGDGGLHGATVMQQALPLGLVDEFRLHVVPVLVGSGTPLFAELAEAVHPHRPDVVVKPAATHLCFTV